MRTHLLAAAAATLIGACAAPPPNPAYLVLTPEQWARDVVHDRDAYQRVTVIRGKTLDKSDYSVFLRSSRADAEPDKDGIVMYVVAMTREWKFLERAFSLDGQEWPLTQIDRDVGYCGLQGCSLYEHVAVHLPRSYLASKTADGIDIKLTGKRGDQLAFVPGPYVQGFLLELPPAGTRPP